jgi:hypothetical protein
MRKFPSLASAALFAAITGAGWVAPTPFTPVQAQQSMVAPRPIPIPEKAELGRLGVAPTGEVFLNGQPDRLSPGARITGQNNLLVLPGSLAGTENTVRYLRDVSGLLHQVWILTPAEMEAEQAKKPGLFDSLFRR